MLGWRAVARDSNQCRQVRTGGVAHQSHAVRVGLEIGRLVFYKLNRGAHVLDRLWIARLAGLGETIVDGIERNPVLGEVRAPGAVSGSRSPLPPAAVCRNHHWILAGSIGDIIVARERDAVVSRVFQVAPHFNLTRLGWLASLGERLTCSRSKYEHRGQHCVPNSDHRHSPSHVPVVEDYPPGSVRKPRTSAGGLNTSSGSSHLRGSSVLSW